MELLRDHAFMQAFWAVDYLALVAWAAAWSAAVRREPSIRPSRGMTMVELVEAD